MNNQIINKKKEKKNILMNNFINYLGGFGTSSLFLLLILIVNYEIFNYDVGNILVKFIFFGIFIFMYAVVISFIINKKNE
jgi:hypothetical protein